MAETASAPITPNRPASRPLVRRPIPLGFERSAGLIVLGFLAGCTLGGPETLYPSEGFPTLGSAQTTRHSVSSLVVSTPTFIDLNLGDPDDGAQVRPTGYTLYDDQGKKMMYIQNYVGYRGSEPLTVELNPGRYLVLLDKPEGQPPKFWVVVEAGKVTRVDLAK